MSGRAGRRGLDTQGNLLYMNMTWPKIQALMLGDIPAITGKDPHYPTIALHHALSGERRYVSKMLGNVAYRSFRLVSRLLTVVEFAIRLSITTSFSLSILDLMDTQARGSDARQTTSPNLSDC